MDGNKMKSPSLNGSANVPAVIVNKVNISYQVFGAGSVGRETESGLGRLLNQARTQVGSRYVHAVKDVSFVAYQGEAVGLIGRNGSGKSTLLRSVAGLIPPSSGSIYLNGRAALLGVNAVLMPKLSGARNIMIGGQALGLTRREVRRRFDEIVDFADIGDFIDLPMSSYSSGMAARLRFAISTAAVPDILVVDEALTTGDAEFRAKAADRIAQIREAAGTIFVVSHSPKSIESTCSRALWLEQGSLIMDDTAASVAAAYAEKYPARPAKRSPKPKPNPRPKVTPQPAPTSEAESSTPPAIPGPSTPDADTSRS